MPGKISVIGLGKLGACIVAAFASKRFNVLGYDTNEKAVSFLNSGKSPVVEPGLSEMLDRYKKNIKATSKPDDIIKNTDITFIIVPTPSKKDGVFSDEYLKDVLSKLAIHLKNKKGHHLFVIDSTVSPQTTEKSLIPLIEKKSGKKLNKGFSVCYNPEFIALGDVIHGILEPDVVLIGESNKKAGDILEKIYKKLCDNKPRISRMSIVSAEIMKISLNSFVTMKISFANMLGNLCERIPGADVDDITQALGADRRISPHYIKAGLSFGGPCFPRDNRAFQAFAKSVGLDAKLSEATIFVHDFQIQNLSKKIKEVLKKKSHNSVSILGLSYKPKTGVIEESASVHLIERMLEHNKKLKIHAYDKLAMSNAKNIFGDRISHSKSAKECLDSSNFWIIASPEKEFIETCKANIRDNIVIVDCWRNLSKESFVKKVEYLGAGGNLYE